MSYIKNFLVSLVAICLASCGNPRGENEIYLGTIAGPETALVELAKKQAMSKYGLNIKIIEFEDYNIPNLALADGSIDANMFQHQPFLDLAIEHKGFELVSIGKTFVYPMGAYSSKHQSLDTLPKGAKVAIPLDPSNGARALRLLAAHGLIDIPDLDDIKLNKSLISSNPRQLQFVEMDSAQLPRILDDVDLAVINTNFAVPAGLKPKQDALIRETKDSPYANIVVVRTEEKDYKKYQQLMDCLHSKEVIDLADHLFDGQAIVAW